MSVVVLCFLNDKIWLNLSLATTVTPTHWISSEKKLLRKPIVWMDGWRWDPDGSASAKRTATTAIYHLRLNVRGELKTKQTLLPQSPAEVWFLEATGSSLLSEACIYKWKLAVQKGPEACGMGREFKNGQSWEEDLDKQGRSACLKWTQKTFSANFCSWRVKKVW